jgi:hypothetical protein
MTKEDKEFIVARLKTPEVQKYLTQLDVRMNEEILADMYPQSVLWSVKQAISYLPHLQQYEFAVGIAGIERYKLLL